MLTFTSFELEIDNRFVTLFPKMVILFEFVSVKLEIIEFRFMVESGIKYASKLLNIVLLSKTIVVLSFIWSVGLAVELKVLLLRVNTLEPIAKNPARLFVILLLLNVVEFALFR